MKKKITKKQKYNILASVYTRGQYGYSYELFINALLDTRGIYYQINEGMKEHGQPYLKVIIPKCKKFHGDYRLCKQK